MDTKNLKAEKSRALNILNKLADKQKAPAKKGFRDNGPSGNDQGKERRPRRGGKPSKALPPGRPEPVNLKHKIKKLKSRQIELQRATFITLNPEDKSFSGETPIVSIDCEMVLCEDSNRHVARVSIVNYNRHILLDAFIKPPSPVKDYLSDITNLNSYKLAKAKPLSEVLPQIKAILKNKIIVGHTIESDLKPLELEFEPKFLRDIADFSGYRDGKFRKGLKALSEEFLNFRIQAGAHSSVEDARATIEVYKINRKEIDLEAKDRLFDPKKKEEELLNEIKTDE